MAAVGKYIHNARHLMNIAIGNTYVPGGQRHQVNFWEAADSIKTTASPIRARISGIYIQVDNIVGAASITMRVTQDAAGDLIIVPDTTANLSTGITTATRGGVVFKVDIDYKHTDSIAWMHFRTNAGNCNIRVVDFIWEE